MNNMVSVSPFRCRMWDLHDRIEGTISEETCKAEIDSFSRHGQLVPVLGRSVRGQADFDIELICGARRLFVARHLNRSLRVELRDISDHDALIAMDAENRLRKDISPYERGMSYSRCLRSGHFLSQDALARALSVSAAQISRLVKLARLPAVIVDAFARPIDIHESWGLDLVEALDDPVRRELMIQRARAIRARGPRPQGKEVYAQLIACIAVGRRPRATRCDEIVKDERGRPLYRIRSLRTSVALLLPVERVSARTLSTIRSTLTGILSNAASHSESEHTERAGRVFRGAVVLPEQGA